MRWREKKKEKQKCTRIIMSASRWRRKGTRRNGVAMNPFDSEKFNAPLETSVTGMVPVQLGESDVIKNKHVRVSKCAIMKT